MRSYGMACVGVLMLLCWAALNIYAFCGTRIKIESASPIAFTLALAGMVMIMFAINNAGE